MDQAPGCSDHLSERWPPNVSDEVNAFSRAFGNHPKRKLVSLPQYKEFFGGNSSGLQVQNVGTSAATVTVTYYPTQPSILSPVVLSHSTPIPPNGNIIFFNVSTPQAGITTVSGSAATLFNTVGGVTITSNQPIVATVNEASFAPNPSGQDTKNYEGFNQ